jgi:hypothetical protein
MTTAGETFLPFPESLEKLLSSDCKAEGSLLRFCRISE